jgi:hypothetical protein
MYDDRIDRIKVLDPGKVKDNCGRYPFQVLLQDKITLQFYLCSTVNIPGFDAEFDEKTGYFPIHDSHMETLIFRCDYKGENIDYQEVAGGGYMDQEEAINQLADKLRPLPCPTCGQTIPKKETDPASILAARTLAARLQSKENF